MIEWIKIAAAMLIGFGFGWFRGYKKGIRYGVTHGIKRFIASVSVLMRKKGFEKHIITNFLNKLCEVLVSKEARDYVSKMDEIEVKIE